jgi:hypothetical protein
MRLALVAALCLPAAAQDREPPYRAMDYGPSLNWTYQVADKHIVYKGIAVRVDDGPGGIAKGRAWVVFDQDTLSLAAAWTAGAGEKAPFIDWKGVAFDGSHNSHARIAGRAAFVLRPGPGFARPSDGSFDDPRFESPVDRRRYGPIPRSWGRFKGLYHHGSRVVFSYSIGETEILETPSLEARAFSRTFHVGASRPSLRLRVAPEGTAIAVVGTDAAREVVDGEIVLVLPPGGPRVFKVLIGGAESAAPSDPAALTKGGPPRWKDEASSKIAPGETSGGFETDELALPENPWRAWMRPGGFDFFPDGKRAAVCTWNGDVWIASGIDGPRGGALSWRRIASGLFQPLGLRVVDGAIYVSCRDQVARLHDLNGDGEIDLVESLNNDHQVTEHFHEFAMGLQTDREGNFYYAKSARHALPALVPHHGTLIRVSKDGATSEIVARGFRAANGVCVNDDGTFFVTDQEGHWTPKNRINRVRPGRFYGNMMAWLPEGQKADDDAMEPPVVWITNAMDRSPAELLWARSASWGPLDGKLLSISYGMGRIFLVLTQPVGDQLQGGVVALPLQFPSGIMRGRFHPGGDLYVCGLFGWSSNCTKPGAFYRVRRTAEVRLPVGLRATRDGLVIAFSCKLDPKTAADPESWAVKTWGLKRSADYGSKHVKERERELAGVDLLDDGASVRLRIADFEPTRGLAITGRLRSADGAPFKTEIHASVHALGEGN